MELMAAVVGVYLGWTVLAMFPRKVVRPSYRLVQDPLVLAAASFLLGLACAAPVAALLVAYLAYVMYNDLPGARMPVAEKAVFVTGCDQGLGHRLARQLDGMGFRVYAGCLFMGAAGEQALVRECSERLTTIQLDVTSKVQVEEAARLVAKDLQGEVLHGVVNNAGILLAANMEVMSYSDIRKIMEVNCMGVVNVYRAFMPLLRQPRRERARLVNVASNLGLAPGAQMGAYAASKAAVMILNETWRYELRPLGIDVATIIPSGFKTGILAYNREAMATKWWTEATEEVRRYFGRDCFTPTHKIKSADDMLATDFTPITSCMVDALLARTPRPVYYKGLMARSLPFLYLHLPAQLWDRVMPYLADFLTFSPDALRDKDCSKKDHNANGTKTTFDHKSD